MECQEPAPGIWGTQRVLAKRFLTMCLDASMEVLSLKGLWTRLMLTETGHPGEAMG